MFIVVVLPQPEGPSSAVNEPCGTSSSRLSTARSAPKCLERVFSVIEDMATA